MKTTVCDFPDETARKEAAWQALVAYVGSTIPDLVVLPEMPFCQWIFVGEHVDGGLWREALAQHEHMLGRLGELKCGWIASSRPIEEDGRRYNEAFLWSAAKGYRAVRRKWYLPDAPIAKETVWFSQGDRNFAAVKADNVDIGFQLCSEVMFPEHAREAGFSGAHLIVQPRAGGNGRHWRVASEMSAVASGAYIACANRRSFERDWFSGESWILSPQCQSLAETSADAPFVTASIDLAAADKAKTVYPRDLQRLYRKH